MLLSVHAAVACTRSGVMRVRVCVSRDMFALRHEIQAVGKHPKVLTIAADIIRTLHGSRITCCKVCACIHTLLCAFGACYWYAASVECAQCCFVISVASDHSMLPGVRSGLFDNICMRFGIVYENLSLV